MTRPPEHPAPSEWRERVAAVLGEHQTEQLWKAGGWAGDTACSCGWRMAMWSKKDFPPVHRAHVASALLPLLAEAQAEVANAFVAWAGVNEIAAPPLDWKWFGEITRRYSPLHEEHDADRIGGER